jgi:hypothetical protein
MTLLIVFKVQNIPFNKRMDILLMMRGGNPGGKLGLN